MKKKKRNVVITKKSLEKARKNVKKSFKCEWCRDYFDDEEEYTNHLQKMHGDYGSHNRLDKKMKTRDFDTVPIEPMDMVVNGRLKIKDTDTEIDILYIWDENKNEYRMHTNELKYQEWCEILGKFAANDKKQHFVVRDIKRLRKDWKKLHPEDTSKMDDGFEIFVNGRK